MASTKSLFFLAFALCVAVLSVNASPLVEIVQPVLPVANYAGLHTFGARRPGDRLATNMAFSEAHSGGQPKEFYKNINLGFGQLITYISAIDQSGSDTKVSIASGGPGHSSAVLRFQSPNGNLAFAIQVYAMNK